MAVGNNNQIEKRLWDATDEMRAIEGDNPDLKDILPKTYNRLENSSLVELLITHLLLKLCPSNYPLSFRISERKQKSPYNLISFLI